MNVKFFTKNRQNLMAKIEDNSMVVLLSGKAPKKSADERYPFTINRNFYYLCGIKEQDIMLVLSNVDHIQESTLFIKQADPVMEKWVGKTISQKEAKELSGVTHVKYVENFTTALHAKLSSGDVEKVYFDLERDNFAESLTPVELYAKECLEKYPYIRIKNIQHTIAALRVIKSKEEVDQIRQAIDITQQGIQSLMEHAKEGMYEYQLEAYFDLALKSRGIRDYAFKTIAASGANATVLHYEENNSIIPKDSLILFDLGAQYACYNADISRTLPASGRFTDRQKIYYNIVLKAQLAVIEAIKPGVPFATLNQIVKDIYFEELKAIGLVETEEDVAKYYYHGVSHYLGLDTHDVGSRSVELQEGMVLTVEPGLYIEEEAIGIRIEDDVLVTGMGCEVLSQGIVKTVEEIERAML